MQGEPWSRRAFGAIFSHYPAMRNTEALGPWSRIGAGGNLWPVSSPAKPAIPAKKRLPGRPRHAPTFQPVVAAAFGRVVRQEREGRGIAQDDFAALADVDRSNYGKLERGERLPSLGTAFRIATALNIAPSVLIARVEDDLDKSTK